MKVSKTIGLAVVLMSVSGCQSISSFFAGNDRATVEVDDATSYFAQLIDEGRMHMRANRPGLAITAFRRASYHADYAGEAYNGMAVAYDSMGRHDLAERFFLSAIEAAPEDARFARNFSRFESLMLARNGAAVDDVEEVVLQADAAEALTTFDDQVAALANRDFAEELPQRMVRMSAGEVRIAGREDWASRLASAETQPPAVVAITRSEPAVDRNAEPASYPVTVAISRVPVIEADDARLALPQEEPEVRANVAAIETSGQLVRRGPQAYPISINLRRGSTF